MFAFNMMATGVNAFQAAAPKIDVIHERGQKIVNGVRRRTSSFSRPRSQSQDPGSMNAETGTRGIEAGDGNAPDEEITYRRKITRDYSPEETRGRRTGRSQRRRASYDSESSLSPPPPVRRLKDHAHASSPHLPPNNQLALRPRSQHGGSPPSTRSSKKSRSPSVSSSSSADLPASSEDEREGKKKKRAAQVMTGVSAIATVNAAANFWLSVKASHERDQKLHDGKITAEEAKKEKLKNQAQDIASIGAAVLTVKVVRNRWKMTRDQARASEQHRAERAERREKRRARESSAQRVEWEIESVGTETEDEALAVARSRAAAGRGQSEMGRQQSSRQRQRPAPPLRLMSHSDDEWDRSRGRHHRSYAPSYAGSSYAGSNAGKRVARRRRDDSSSDSDTSDGEYHEGHAYYDMGYDNKKKGPDADQHAHHHHHHHHHHHNQNQHSSSSSRPRQQAYDDRYDYYDPQQSGAARSRAQSVYSDGRGGYDDYQGRPAARARGYRGHGHGYDDGYSSRRDGRKGGGGGGGDREYKEGKNNDMMNLGNF